MIPLGLIGKPNPEELILLLLIIMLLFGAKRIPDLARSLGRSIGEFKKGRAEGEQEAKESDKERLEKSDPPKIGTDGH